MTSNNRVFQESIAEETRLKLSVSTKLRDAESSLETAEMDLSGATEEIRILQTKNSELQSQVCIPLYTDTVTLHTCIH